MSEPPRTALSALEKRSLPVEPAREEMRSIENMINLVWLTMSTPNATQTRRSDRMLSGYCLRFSGWTYLPQSRFPWNIADLNPHNSSQYFGWKYNGPHTVLGKSIRAQFNPKEMSTPIPGANGFTHILQNISRTMAIEREVSVGCAVSLRCNHTFLFSTAQSPNRISRYIFLPFDHLFDTLDSEIRVETTLDDGKEVLSVSRRFLCTL